MTPDLRGPRAKIERAWEHRYALEREVEPARIVERHLIQVRAEKDPQSGYHVLRVSVIPDDWVIRVATLVGDIAHNLRSALDQIAWQLVVHHSGRPKRPSHKIQVEFPAKYRRQALASTYTFSKVSPADRTILDGAQPYNTTGNPKLAPLAVVQQLSNRDKHRVFNPVFVATRAFTFAGSDLDGMGRLGSDWVFSGFGKRLKVGTELMRCRFPEHVDDEVEMAGYAGPEVKLPQGSVGIVAGMSGLIVFVEKLLGDFAAQPRV